MGEWYQIDEEREKSGRKKEGTWLERTIWSHEEIKTVCQNEKNGMEERKEGRKEKRKDR